jgi:hypothetical protein
MRNITERPIFKPATPREPGYVDNPIRYGFAYPLDSLDELDTDIAMVLTSSLQPGESFQKIIVAPKQRTWSMQPSRWSWLLPTMQYEISPDWILALTETCLILVAIPQSTGPVKVTVTPIADILAFEMGELLLFCWFEWSWNNANHLEKTRVYFNGVSEPLFYEVLNFIRSKISVSELNAQNNGQYPAVLDQLPFKFKNYARRLLLPAEQVQSVLFRPAVTSPRWDILHKKLIPGLAMIFTDHYISLTREELTDITNYGMISQYYPRRYLQAAALQEEAQGMWLNLVLREGEVIMPERVQIPLEAATDFNQWDQTYCRN